jgi:hypothetical protein
MATVTIQTKICPTCHARFEGAYEQRLCINCFRPDPSKAWPLLRDITCIPCGDVEVTVMAKIEVPDWGVYRVSFDRSGLRAQVFLWQCLPEPCMGRLIRSLLRLYSLGKCGEEMPLQISLVPNKEAYERALLAY